MRILKILGAAVGGLVVLVFFSWLYASGRTEPRSQSPYAASNERVEGARLHTVAIAPPQEALTFARVKTASGLRLLRVEKYENAQVTGVDITGMQRQSGVPDPIALWSESGYDSIARQDGQRLTVPVDQLDLPFDGTATQIAMGATYPDHATEATLKNPFVFPKLRHPERWNAAIPVAKGLLDYEIELGFVALRTVQGDARGEAFGLVLASDYTDRAMLMREIDLADTASGQGYARSKSVVPMPVGTLFVIPRDLRSFYKRLDLRLYVNGQLRQIALPKNLSWDIDQMVKEAFKRRDVPFAFADGHARLPIPDAGIPARTIILSGTTDGVAFRRPTGRQIFVGVIEWIASLRWSQPRLFVERALTEARDNLSYLQPGDTVVMRADYLGFLVNPIVP
ncbi:MAG: fumarylacetoacetate hydrolase family protein [Pseudomonadota bacterium]